MSTPVDLRQNPSAQPSPAPTAPQNLPPKEDAPQSFSGHLWDILKYALIAAAVIIPVRIFIAQPFIVSGKSMYPTFKNGEYLIVDELTKRTSGYERGDVVILRYPNDPSEFYIKRVIGLPGEIVSLSGGVTEITKPDGTKITLDESYVKNPKNDSLSRKLSDTEYFVMGDNRAQSSDSRSWGPVPARLMDGKALLRLFPPTRIELHPGSIEKHTAEYEKSPPEKA
jgi:signal peptidase I